jgi:LuxR family maltose regulon positive regulatory protein
MTGGAEAAVRFLEEDVEGADPTNHMFLTRVFAAQAFVHLLCGDLSPTVRTARRLAVLAERIPNVYAGNWAHYLQAVPQLHAHQLDDALRAFRSAVEQRDIFEGRVAVDALAGLALTYQLLQRPDSAASVADEILAFVQQRPESEYVAPAESFRARLSLLQGDLKAAVDWARSDDAECDAAGMFLWIENPSITRARVRIAEGTEDSVHMALESLGSLRPQLERMHRTVQTIEVVVLQSLGLQKQGRIHEALATLEEAVTLAVPGGWIRPFVEAGPDMAALLQRLGGRGRHDDVIQRILAAFPGRAAPAEPPLARAAEPSPATGRSAVDSITNRELDILELLAQRLANKEIAARLFISTHTVKDHLKRIYDKLGAHNRRQAVKRAIEMGVLSRR